MVLGSRPWYAASYIAHPRNATPSAQCTTKPDLMRCCPIVCWSGSQGFAKRKNKDGTHRPKRNKDEEGAASEPSALDGDDGDYVADEVAQSNVGAPAGETSGTRPGRARGLLPLVATERTAVAQRTARMRVRRRVGRRVLGQCSPGAVVAAGSPQPHGQALPARVVPCDGVWARAMSRLRDILAARRRSWALPAQNWQPPSDAVRLEAAGRCCEDREQRVCAMCRVMRSGSHARVLLCSARAYVRPRQ